MRPILAAALALALAAALPAHAGARARAHVDPRGEQECAACHRTGTPEVFAAWEASPHGLALVKCVVCHGSTGKDFRARPAADGCRGCHAEEAESLASGSVKDCFACHAPHSLSAHPHR
jgi:Cytochrome c554 and c-prime